MKVTVVPAQVTTVEDRIIGNLTFTQMLFLVVPIFLSAALFAVIPPFMAGSLLKYLSMASLGLVCSILAVRIRGKILAAWLITLLRYNLRPKYYVFNKNTLNHREDFAPLQNPKANEAKEEVSHSMRQPRLAFADTAKVLAAIENPAAKVRFETTKNGGLHVRLTEIEE